MESQQQNTETKGPEFARPSSVAMLTALLCAVIVVILGGLYLWGSLLSVEDLAPSPVVDTSVFPNNREPETPRTNADIQLFQTLSSSDELSAVTADLDATNIELLDTELQSMEAEVDTFESQTR